MAFELKQTHKPSKHYQLSALTQKQDISSNYIPLETTNNKESTLVQLEGGGSNSNINMTDSKDHDNNNHQQQYSNQNYNQGSQIITKNNKNIPLQEQRSKKPNPGLGTQNNYNMFPTKAAAPRGMMSVSQPTSSSNLYSGMDGGKSSRDAVLPEILSNHQIQAISSIQNMSATSLSNIHSFQENKQPDKNHANSGVNKSSANLVQLQFTNLHSKQTQKRNYLYCIDTRQIIAMMNYCIDMIQVPCKSINKTIETLEKQQKPNYSDLNGRKQQILNDISVQNNSGHRSKSSNEVSNKKSTTGSNSGRIHGSGKRIHGSKLLNDQNQYMDNQNLDDSRLIVLQNNQLRTEIFCSGNKEMIGLVSYFNYKLKSQIENVNKQQKGNLFKVQKSENTKKELSKVDSFLSLDFCKVFSLDQKTQNNIVKFSNRDSQSLLGNTGQQQDNSFMGYQFLKFTYLVENEKILTKQMFYIDVQRESFCQTLKEIKELLSSFIQRKYKNCITKIGFSTQHELYNIFNKMFNSKKGFFSNIFVRKVLSCFWMSIREIFYQIRLKQFDDNPNSASFKVISRLSQSEETMLKNNFYMRLEMLARGRQVYEPYLLDFQLQALHNFIVPMNQPVTNTLEKQSSCSTIQADSCYSKLFPLHQAIFESNLRMLSKLLKQEVEGVFYINKNSLDPCGNTPLMLAVKLGNLDAVKILSDVYTCPKLRSLPDLMNAKEIAIAMKNQSILKILFSSNQKLKQQFFEDNKNAIFSVLEGIPDFKVDLNLTCDSNLFPVFSSVAPSDTYKIYKQGSNLRLDMTLLGLQGFNLLKGNITVLYKGRNTEEPEQAGELLIIDNKLQTVNNVFNRNQETKVNTEIQNILSGKQILKKYQTHSSSIQVETDRSNKPIFKNVNDYECQKWILKSRYTMTKYQMNLNQIDEIKGLKNFQDYVENLEVDFLQLLESQLNAYYNEKRSIGGQDQSNSNHFISNRFKPVSSRGDKPDTASLVDNVIPYTSRVNLGGTSKLDKQGILSDREGSKLRGEACQQMYTQEDQLNNSSAERIGGILAQRGSLSTQNNILANNKHIIIKKNQQKHIHANLWLSRTYPFDIETFLPLFHVLSFCSKQIRQFNKFLLKYPLPKNSFPVEARIPLMMTMEAVFSFKNLQLGFKDSTVFELDKLVSQKQQENMAIYAKQQISYLNQHSSLDTQEDKQARALREIYKLCKTDEGESGDNYQVEDDLYRFMEQAKAKETPKVPKERPEDDIEGSESSEHIKQRFNRMQDEAYDINQDLVRIEENDAEYSDCNSALQRLKKSKIIQQKIEEEKEENVIQSRNFASKSSFHDIKKSLTQSEFLKMRKSNQPHGRTPSNQFSLQSDITESIEVSERSFNDKLAKLQIHSFQNVKFMSQLKKQKESKDQGIDKNLQKILNEQFKPKQIQGLHPNRNTNIQQYQKAKLPMTGAIQNNMIFHNKGQISNNSQTSHNMENIYDSKINEQRPKINKSLGKHQIKNNLHLYAKNITSNAIVMKHSVGKPPIIVNASKSIRPKNIAQNIGYSQSNNSFATNGDESVNQKDFQPKPVPVAKQNNYIQQPNKSIGNSIVSMGVSNFDTSSINQNSISSLSYANLESRNIGQMPSSTNDSSKMMSSTCSHKVMMNPASKQQRVLDNLKLKMLIRNQQGNQNYLNTIESEGNLPTQQFGKGENKMTKDCNNLSQRSIHSLDEVENEQMIKIRSAQQKDIESYEHESFQNFINKNNFQENVRKSQEGSVSSYKLKQVFSYEKQKLDQQSVLHSESIILTNSNIQSESVNAQPIYQSKPVQNQQKMNFFQKMTHFISESITDRKHHNQDQSQHLNEYQTPGQQLIHSNTISKNKMALLMDGSSHDHRSQEEEVFTKNLDRVGSSFNRTEKSGTNASQHHSKERQFTTKKVKRAVATPTNIELVSPLKQYVGPGTTGREEMKKQKALNDKRSSQIEGGQQEQSISVYNSQNILNKNKNALHLQQMINLQLINKKNNLTRGPNVLVSKPLEPHRNTTQTDGSAQVLKKKLAPSTFLNDEQSPLQEGHIHNFNNRLPNQ